MQYGPLYTSYPIWQIESCRLLSAYKLLIGRGGHAICIQAGEIRKCCGWNQLRRPQLDWPCWATSSSILAISHVLTPGQQQHTVLDSSTAATIGPGDGSTQHSRQTGSSWRVLAAALLDLFTTHTDRPYSSHTPYNPNFDTFAWSCVSLYCDLFSR